GAASRRSGRAAPHHARGGRVSTATVLFTGSREWPDIQLLAATLMDVWHDALQNGYTGIRPGRGDAEGRDYQCGMWCDEHGIEQQVYEARWEDPCTDFCQPGHRRLRGGASICPAAGPLRNQLMVDDGADVCVAAHHNDSR